MSSRVRVGAWVASATVGIASVALLVAAPAGAAPAGAAAAGAAAAGPAGAPGNNGTVKIHEGAGEPAPEPRNEPHVCTFHVHALHFDGGQVLTFSVRSWEPTGDRSVVLTGSITADATGAGRAPVSGAYSLPAGHYRLTVDTGNGTPTQDKHKMFWVRCAPETTPPTTPSSPPPTCPTSPGCTTPPSCTPAPGCTTSPGSPSSPSTPGTPTASVPSTGTPSATPTAGGGAATPPGTPPTAGGLAVTGSSTAAIAGIGLAVLLAGVALLCTPAARRRLFGG